MCIMIQHPSFEQFEHPSFDISAALYTKKNRETEVGDLIRISYAVSCGKHVIPRVAPENNQLRDS